MNAVDTHYGRPGLGARILEALRGAGKDVDHLTPQDLAPLDQFHILGHEATLELARLAALRAGATVVDVGGGIGGPARVLARDFGCRVTVLDLTEEFCRAGADLTRRAGLGDQVRFEHGSALRMPFADGAFDAGWTQHSSMNIEDKDRLYEELRRVVRPGGRLALHEIMGGPTNQPIHFPVPWARDASISFLRPAPAIRRLLADLGFKEMTWTDTSARSLAWVRERRAAAAAVPAGGPPPLGVGVLLGPDAAPMFGNVERNLQEERIVVVEAVFERP